MDRQLDNIDKKLITMLNENARYSLKELAGAVSLSSPATATRIERLEKDEFITGYSAKINRQKLGYNITAFISMDVPPPQKETFYPFIKACPNVIECNCITGNYSMFIKVAFKATQELDSFIGTLQSFGKTQTQIVFSTPVEPREIQLD